MDIILSNWAEILLGIIAVADIIVSATPSTKDDKVLGYFRVVVNALSGRNKRKKK
jgi:uncharacterized membrane protein